MADNKTSIVISAEDKTGAALASVRNGLKGMESAFAGLDNIAGRIPMLGAALAGAFSAVSFTGVVKGAIDAADELNDLSQKLGISVEDLAGFKFAAEQSGTSLEGVAKGVKQLARYMGENGDKLKAAGITAEDATGALIQLADQFARMPDGTQKTAVAMEVLGKAGADLIPLLNGGGAALRDMLEEGKRLYPVTEEMARQADAFNDSLAKLKTTAGGVGIAIANELLPPLNALSDRLAQAFAGGVVEGFTSRWAAAFKGLAAGINETLAAAEEFLGKITFGKVAENHLKKALEYRDAAKKIYAELSALAPADQRSAPAKSPPSKGSVTSLLGKGDGKGAGKTVDADEWFYQDTKKSLAEDDAMLKKWHADMDAKAKKEAEAMQRYRAMLDPLQKYRDMLAEIDTLQWANVDEKLAMQMKVNDLMQEEFDRMTDVNDKLAEQKDIARDLGMTFSSAFEDAIVGGKNLSETLKGLSQDILRIVTRKTITEPLAAAISSSVDFSSLFGGVPKYATGTDYVPGDGLAYLHKGEAVIPAAQNRGGGIGSVRVEIVNQGTRQLRVETAEPRFDAKGMIVSVILGDLSQNGPIAQSIGGRYGLRGAT